MILKTLREFELEQEVRDLQRELYHLRRGEVVPVVAEETPEPIRATWEETERVLYRVASCERVYEPDARGYRTLLECRHPAPNQRLGDPVRIWRQGYFIALAHGMKDDHVARVAANMHLQMLAALHREYLQPPSRDQEKT